MCVDIDRDGDRYTHEKYYEHRDVSLIHAGLPLPSTHT